jgi:hypothetical protein
MARENNRARFDHAFGIEAGASRQVRLALYRLVIRTRLAVVAPNEVPQRRGPPCATTAVLFCGS